MAPGRGPGAREPRHHLRRAAQALRPLSICHSQFFVVAHDEDMRRRLHYRANRARLALVLERWLEEGCIHEVTALPAPLRTIMRSFPVGPMPRPGHCLPPAYVYFVDNLGKRMRIERNWK